MRYGDFRDDCIADLIAVLVKHGGKIVESDDCGEWIVSMPPTDNGKRMGAVGSFFYLHEVANRQFSEQQDRMLREQMTTPPRTGGQ